MASNIVEIKLSEIDQVQEVLSKQNKEIERLNNKLNIQEEKFKKWNKVLNDDNKRLNNIINKIEEHFVLLKINSIGGNKEFFEDVLEYIRALKELKGSDKE